MGGVCATTCDGANFAFGGTCGAAAFFCAFEERQAKARAASERVAKMRMVHSFVETISDGILCPLPAFPQLRSFPHPDLTAISIFDRGPMRRILG
jgi:hypothetical protein